MRHIRNKFGDIIYCIRDDGTITDKFDCDVVGHLKGDRITDKLDIDTLYRIRQDGTITDKYDCDIIGHIREDGSITDKYDIDTQGRVDVPHSSSGSSEVDLLSIIVGLIVILIKIIPALFMYFLLPLLLSQTIWFFLFIFLSAPLIGFNPFIAYGGMVIMYVVALPYWYILFAKKRKKHMTWKETFKYYRKWYIKGPWAYKDINELKNKPMGN